MLVIGKTKTKNIIFFCEAPFKLNWKHTHTRTQSLKSSKIKNPKPSNVLVLKESKKKK